MMTQLHAFSQPSLSDTELFLQWNHGDDEDAVAALWLRYQRLATAVAARVLSTLPDPQDAGREVADAAFVRALQTFDPARAGTSRHAFRNWYVTIARNGARDTLRRDRRLVYEVPEAGLAPEASGPRMDAALDLRRVLPRIRAFVLDNFLPSDWTLLSVWLDHESEGKRVPWSRIADEHTLSVDTEVSFPRNSTAFATHRIEPVVRLLRTCVATQVQVEGGATEDESPELAHARAQQVARLLTEQLRVKRLPSPDGKGADRVVIGECTDTVATVRFVLTAGARRTPASLRMRVSKVLLPRIRAFLAGHGVVRQTGMRHGG